MKNFIITSAVCIAMILSSASSMAQQITIVSGKVLNLPEGEKKPRPFPMGETVRIFAFNTVASARDALKALETGGGGTLLFDADAVAGADGYYEIRVAENGALIFNVQMKNELREVNYKQEINANIDGGIALEEVEVVAENPNPQPRPVAGKIVGNKLIVNNSVAIPSNYGAPNRRLIMQPYIMDCTTEEIVSYMDPTVMDGPEYGLTQDRRMAYDIRNDKLAPYINTRRQLDATRFNLDSGFPREEFKLKFGAFGAEPWTENMRRDIEAKLGIKAYDIYGLSEIAGPGVGYECECQHGTHLNEDHYFPEIVDPNTLEPVAPGETGELVFTHLTKEGMPLLRYRTKDLTALHYDKCPCGRTLVRMDRILGRSDDMLIIRGVNVFPTQIESVILEMPEFEPHYLLLVDRKNNTDTMELQVEVRPEYYSDEINKMLALKKKLTARLQSVLGLGVDVRLVEPRSIERSVGKAKRVIDNRKL